MSTIYCSAIYPRVPRPLTVQRRATIGSQLTHQEQSQDRWLVSYADYMTLMFALFVVLYAAAIVKEEQYQVLSLTLGKVFEVEPSFEQQTQVIPDSQYQKTLDNHYQQFGQSLNEVKGPSLLDEDVDLSNIKEAQLGHSLGALHQELKDALDDLLDKGYAKVRLSDDWLTIELGAELLFVSGSAGVTPSAQLVLEVVNGIIAPIDNYIRVRGYTDDQPINNEIYQSNWALSLARATSILTVLEMSGINPARMAIEGYGQYAPFDDNRTLQGRRNNRKVVIALSKYAWSPPQFESLPLPLNTDTQSKTLNEESSEDSREIYIIELPSGGLRITTRRDEQQQQPKVLK